MHFVLHTEVGPDKIRFSRKNITMWNFFMIKYLIRRILLRFHRVIILSETRIFEKKIFSFQMRIAIILCWYLKIKS